MNKKILWFVALGSAVVVMLIITLVYNNVLKPQLDEIVLENLQKNIGSTPKEEVDGEYVGANEKNEKNKVPDFTVYDIDENPVSFENFLGKPIVMNIWASWCPPCKEELPTFELLAEEMKDDINFVMVNMTDGNQETFGGAKSFLAKNGYAFDSYFDIDLEAYSLFYRDGVPITVFVDAEGYLQYVHTGMLSEEALREIILLLNG